MLDNLFDIFRSPYFPWRFFFGTLAFCWGASIGSFLNVCIYRIPNGRSVVQPRSFCPLCRRQIPWYLNIPLVSWLGLKARCTFCGGRIKARYFLVELLTAILFFLVWLQFDLADGPRLLALTPIDDVKLIPVYWLMISGLILGTFVDFDYMIIPDRVTLGGIVAGVALSALVPSMHGQTSMVGGVISSMIGAAAGWATLWSVAAGGKLLLKKDAMGFGDVKLIGAIGAFLGWKAVFFVIALSSCIGSLVGVALVVMRMKHMQSRIPYGPYLALAALIWIFWGVPMVEAYLRLFTPDPVSW